jgi:nicotinamidase-related amidase
MPFWQYPFVNRQRAPRSGTRLFCPPYWADDSPFSEKGPLTQLIPELDVKEQDVVFTKRHPSCFRDTVLLRELNQRGIKQLVIAGMKTEFCVDTTCRAAPELGFRTVLISDAHTTMDNDIIRQRHYCPSQQRWQARL